MQTNQLFPDGYQELSANAHKLDQILDTLWPIYDQFVDLAVTTNPISHQHLTLLRAYRQYHSINNAIADRFTKMDALSAQTRHTKEQALKGYCLDIMPLLRRNIPFMKTLIDLAPLARSALLELGSDTSATKH